MIKLDAATTNLLNMLNKLDPDGPEMSKVSEPMKNILKELTAFNTVEDKQEEGTLTESQWAIVQHINNMAVHIGFDLVVEPFDSEIVPKELHGQNLLILREHPSGVVLNWSEIILDKMDVMLTSVLWVIQSLFNYYKAKYETIKSSEDAANETNVSQD